MAAVPPALAALSGLQHLGLGADTEEGVRLCSGLERLAALGGLSSLELRLDDDVPLSALSTLTWLAELSVFSRHSMGSVQAVSALRHLTTLFLHATDGLPAPWLGGLTALQQLHMYGKGFALAEPHACCSCRWDCLLPLRRLTSLGVSSILNSVPPALGLLTNLSKLHMQCNNFTAEAGWEHLCSLSLLEELDLTGLVSCGSDHEELSFLTCLGRLTCLALPYEEQARIPAAVSTLAMLERLSLWSSSQTLVPRAGSTCCSCMRCAPCGATRSVRTACPPCCVPASGNKAMPCFHLVGQHFWTC